MKITIELNKIGTNKIFYIVDVEMFEKFYSCCFYSEDSMKEAVNNLLRFKEFGLDVELINNIKKEKEK